MLTSACCLVVGLGSRFGLGVSGWLVVEYLYYFPPLSLPLKSHERSPLVACVMCSGG